MKDSAHDLTRAVFVKRAIVLPALAGLLAAATVRAEAKGTKAQFKYQTSPNNGHKCSACSFFVAGSSPTAAGSCKIVDGSISPNGWCTAFAPKS